MAEQERDQAQERNIDTATTRRAFFNRAMAAASGVALVEFLPNLLVEAQTCSPTPCFANPGEIKSLNSGVLRGVITIKNETRTVQGVPKRVRFFAGYNPSNPSVLWPVTPGAPAPGPTLRAKVGDKVNLILLNHVNVRDFRESVNAGMGSDNAERGLGCDASTAVIDGAADKNWYPKDDKFADCFHGSNTGNLHFHGTHTNPDNLGDNVLVQILPSAKDSKGNFMVTEKSVRPYFDQIFAMAHCPTLWNQIPQPWRNGQTILLNQYDQTQEWMGKPGLPQEMKLLPKNQDLINKGLWPQYFMGAYPYCFELPAYQGGAPGTPIMGQAPGTHWYHAHKHGSTALHLLNGLAGAFIIEGQYDIDLRKIYPTFDAAQKVLVIQEFDDTPNLIRAQAGPRTQLVNGLLTPTITMQPGEVQLWRFVNAAQSLGGGKPMNIQFAVPASGAAPKAAQIAQDGVQYKWENFAPQLTTPKKSFSFATGNRIDLLIQAPSAPGNFTLLSNPPPATGAPPVLVNVQVTGSVINPAQQFPNASNYPGFPPFLKDIDPTIVHKTRTLTFGWEKNRVGAGRNAQPLSDASLNSGPIWNIDGKQFEDGVIDQLMLLNSAEDWIIYNYTTVNHTFHIHVNPFQLIQVHDPNANPPDTYAPAKDFIWQDTIALPSALVDPATKKMILDPLTGLAKTPGFVKIRQHFVDFPGTFVLHCHILGHEDRGMMQLIQVQDNKTPFKHH